jgi:hypothetical protein
MAQIAIGSVQETTWLRRAIQALVWSPPIRFVLSYVLGTPQYKWRLRKVIIRESRTNVQQFLELKALDEHRKRQLKARMCRHSARIAAWNAQIVYFMVLSYFVVIFLYTRYGARLVFSSLSAILILYFVMILAYLPVLIYNRFGYTRNLSDALFITSLMGTLSAFERAHPRRWCDLSFRRNLMRQLEGLAVIVERRLPKGLRSGDIETDRWVRKRTWQVASAIRELKQWLVTPTSLTRTDLTHKLATCLENALDGEWEKLIHTDSEMPEKPPRSVRLMAPMRVFVKWLLPLVGAGLLFWYLNTTDAAAMATKLGLAANDFKTYVTPVKLALVLLILKQVAGVDLRDTVSKLRS